MGQLFGALIRGNFMNKKADTGFSIRKCFLFAWEEYVHWLLRPKMCILIVLFLFIHQLIVMPVTETAAEMKTGFSVLEPFVALGTSGVVLMILPVCYIVLMADYPEFRTGGWFFVGRLGRLNWLIGQFIFGVMSVLSYIIFIAVFTIGASAFRAKWSFQWSDFCLNYHKVFPEREGDFVDRLFPENLYNQTSLLKAVVHTYLLLACYLLLLLLILMLGKLLKHRMLGIFCTGGIVAVGTALCSLRVQAMWYFPMAHSIVWLHYTEYFRKQIFPVRSSYVLFGMALMLLGLTAAIRIYTYQFDVQES